MPSTNSKPPQTYSGVFRSEKMVLFQLFLQPDVAFRATCQLGELGIVEFRDLNKDMNAFQRKFVDEMRKIGEIQRKLIYLNEQLAKDNVKVNYPNEEPEIPRFREIIKMEQTIEEYDMELKAINEHLHTLRLKEFELIEKSKILAKTNELLAITRRHSFSESNSPSFSITLDEPDGTSNINTAHITQSNETNKIFTVTGLLPAEKELPLRKVIWRVCGQNALVQFFDVEEPIDDLINGKGLVQKKVFLVMCQGQQLHQKIGKICDAFRATRYRLPEHDDEYQSMCYEVEKDLKDIKLVIEQSREQKTKILMLVAEEENFQTWVIRATKIRSILSTMNLYQKTEKGFLAEGWCAYNDFHLLNRLVMDINENCGIQGQACVEKVQTTATPPTYFRTNRFTRGFQNIVDSYGVADYGEMNPAPYTIITFPFLFALMFADAGHGLIMFLFGFWMVFFEMRLKGKSSNEIWLMFFEGRYIIMLMGAFSIYTGSIYNDIFAKSYNLFGTGFEPPENITTNYVYLEKTSSWTYPYAVDPAWQLSQNKILFLNSFKMKFSVIVGVMQMFFGVILSLLNHINRCNIVSILFEFFPQIIFLVALFGYMNALIFAKWFIKWKPYKAPSILIDFINMFLNKYPKEPEYLKPWFEGKQALQIFIIAVVIIQVPIMLLVKPTWTVMKRRMNKGRSSVSISRQENGEIISESEATTSTESTVSNHSDDEHSEESTGDIYIHQAIHTIEYCLGSVSHTASYLRLWALSLAHSQLSEVLWNMVMKRGFAALSSNLYVNALMTFVTFSIWAVLTVIILVVMEGLSAFLHALRLHWVEFQSKFYSGSGYPFKPFNLKRTMIETNILKDEFN